MFTLAAKAGIIMQHYEDKRWTMNRVKANVNIKPLNREIQHINYSTCCQASKCTWSNIICGKIILVHL